MTRLIPLLALLCLTGCETCREHPYACGAVAAVAAGSLAACANRNGEHQTDIQTPRVDCHGGVSCQ